MYICIPILSPTLAACVLYTCTCIYMCVHVVQFFNSNVLTIRVYIIIYYNIYNMYMYIWSWAAFIFFLIHTHTHAHMDTTCRVCK